MNMVNLDLSAIYQQLMDFASLDSFWQSFDSVYSTDYDFASAEALRLQWANGDFSGLPQVDIVESQGLGSAVASYNPSKNTIDLSEEFFTTASSAQLNDLILSEIGYFVASLVQARNAPEQGRNLGDFITPLSAVQGAGEFNTLEFSALADLVLDQQGGNLGDFITPLSTMQGTGEFKTLEFSDSADLVLNSGNIQGIRQGLTSLLFNLNSSFSQKLGGNGLFGQLSSALLENLKQNSGFSLLQTLSTDIDQLFDFNTNLSPQDVAERITQILKNSLIKAGVPEGLIKAGVKVIKSTPEDLVSMPKQLRYQLAFESKNTNNFDLNTDLGISNLDLSFTGAVGLDIDLSVVLDFGIDLATNNFFVDTVRKNELSANVTLQNTQDLVGELGFLSLTASDRSPTEKTFRSSLGFSLDLLDEPDDADDLLNFSQLSTITNLDPLLTGSLNLNPNLKLGSESLTYLPKLTTELAFNTKYDFAKGKFVDVNNPETSPTINFNNVQLDLSSVFGEDSLIFGLLSEIYEVIKPVAEVLDALTKNIDFITGDFPALGLNSDDFKEIVNKFLGTRGGSLNNDIFPIFKEDKRITILDLLIVGGSIYERITGEDAGVTQLIKSIPLIKVVTEFTTTLEKSKELGSGKLGFGNFSFTLDNAEESALANVGANVINKPIFSGTVDSSSISDVKNKLSGFGKGFAFPLIDDPQVVFNYLTGRENFDLFTYDLPTFDFKLNFDDLVNIPIFGPLGFTIGAGIGMQAFAGSPDFGFNSQGLTSGSNNLGDIISSGFYLVDKVGGQEKPEVIIGGNISAGVSIAPPGAGSSLIKLGGKIGAQADFDLINGLDPNKVFLKELRFPFFYIDGKIFAQLNAKVNIKLSTVLKILEALRTTNDASDLLLKKYLEGAVRKAGFSPEFVGDALLIVNAVTKPLEVIEEVVDRIPIGGKVGRFFKQAFKTVTRTVKKVVGTITETVIAGSELLDSVSVGLDLNSPELILWQASFSNGGNGGGSNNGTTGYDYLYASIGGVEDTLILNTGNRVTRDIITPPNALPVLSTVNKYGIEDRVFVFVADNFTNAFSDANGDSLTKIKIISLSANGSLKLGNNAVTVNQEIAVANLGSLTFVPNANFNGNTSFSWNGFDGTNYANAAATVAIAITAVNDLPVISNINKSGNTNSSVAFSAPDFTSKFTDADGNSLSKIKIVSLPNGGVLKLGNVNVSLNQEIPTSSLSSLSFVPNSGFGGNTSFAWNGFDGTDYSSNWAWVNLTYPVIPAITLAVSPSSVTEDGISNLVYTFTRTGPTTNALTVNYGITGTADSADYSGATPGSNKTITFAAGSNTVSLTINPTADTTVEPDQTVILTLASGTGYSVGTTNGVTGTITNDDEFLPDLVPYKRSGWDGEIVISTTTGTTTNSSLLKNTDTLYIDWAVLNQGIGPTSTKFDTRLLLDGVVVKSWFTNPPLDSKSSAFVNDYSIGTLSAGNHTLTIEIDYLNTQLESNELNNSFTRTFTVVADLPTITLTVNPSSVAEDGISNLVYTFTRTGPTTNALTVNYGITGTADSADYSGATPGSNKTITFAAGSSTVSLTINPIADTTVEPDQTVILTLASGTGYTIGTTNSVTGTITNDDSNNDNFANRIPVSGTVVAINGTNVGFTGETGEPNQSGALNSAWWSWTAPVSGNVTIDTIGSNFDTVLSVYTGNALNALAEVPGGVNDDIGGDDDNDDVLQSRVSFSATSGTTYQIAVDGYEDITGNINLNILLSTSPSVTIAVSPSSVTENGPNSLVFTLARTGNLNSALTVNYDLSGTASLPFASGEDYRIIGSTANIANFAAGSDTTTIIVDPIADFNNELDETVTVTITSGSGYTIGTQATATGTIINGPPTSGNDYIVGTDFADIIDALAGNDTILSGAGNDIILGGSGNDSILGQNGNDSLTGNSGNDTIYGGSGDDVIDGGDATAAVNDGNDELYGESGIDTIYGGDGSDIILGGDGNDELYGESGNDTLAGGNGSDFILGGDGNDWLYGESGNDIILGGDGDDYIEGGTGNDTLGGGNGRDTFYFFVAREDAGVDTIGFSNDLFIVSQDRISYANTSAPSHSITSQGISSPGIYFTNINLGSGRQVIVFSDQPLQDSNIDPQLDLGIFGFASTPSLNKATTFALSTEEIATIAVNTDFEKSTIEDSVIAFTATDFSTVFSQNLTKIKITELPNASAGRLELITPEIIFNIDLNEEIALADLDKLVFIPNENFNGNASFSWTGFNGTAFVPTPAKVNLTITPVADRPTLADVNKYGPASVVTFTQNDFIKKFTDVDGDALTKIKITSLPANGTLKLGNTNVDFDQEIPVASLNNLTFTPNAGFSESTSFGWNGFDGTNYAFFDANVNLTLNNPGNSLNTAFNIGQLLETKRYNNSIGQAGSSDYYRLEMLDFGLLTVLLEDLSSNVDLQLLNVSGEVLQSSTQTATQSERVDFAVDPGTYFIRVLQVDAASTDYTLRLTPNIDEVVRIVHLGDGIDGEVIAVLKPAFPGAITEFSQEFSGIKKISAGGGKGNDIIELQPGVKSPAELMGDEGNDRLQGGDGRDSLSGGVGDDTLIGGLGADTLNGDDGIDTVDYSASNAAVTANLTTQIASGGHAQGDRLIGIENIEGSDFNDNLTGSDADNLLLGGTGNDTLSGGAGNDILVGGLGNDSMSGGTGNDTYLVDSLGDVVRETSTLSTEIDDVQSIVDYTLPANVENLLLNGSVAVRGTGNALNNTIIGNNLNNILDGGAGDDLLIGDLGNDTMIGGTGNDTYFVDSLGDVVIETSTLATEIDTVQSSVNFTLGANLEDLILTDSAIIGIGNSLNNFIFGNEANNTLIGNAGNDTLFGDLGNDILIAVNSTNTSPGKGEIDLFAGGLGADRFILGDANWLGYDDGISSPGINDYADITDFESNEGDTIQLKGRSNDYSLFVLGQDTQIRLNKPGNEPDELIGIIRGKTNLNLNGSYFTYILGQNEDPPVITLAVSPSSVTEDGVTNLVYTFTRTGPTTNTLTVNYGITGTADSADYSGATPGSNKTIAFAAGSRTVSLTVNPTADTTVEPDQTVILTLASGTGYTIGTTNGVTGTITNDDIFQPNLPPTLFAIAHNTFNNTNSGWLVKGGTLENSFSLTSWVGWKPTAIGDFNFDGQSDIIVTQPSTGYNALWVTNQGQVSWVAGLPSWGTEWQVVDTGDFNSDGNTDILVTNPSTGWNAVWNMYGTTYGSYTSASFWGGWQAVAAGDMNNDGNMDILVNYPSEGWNAVHLMDGRGGLLSTEILPSWGKDWKITGTADINGDGKTDILASYPSQGWNIAWIMNDTQFGYQQGFPGGFGTEVVL